METVYYIVYEHVCMSEEDDQQKKKLVGVRIEEDRRQRWKQEIEDSDEFNSMAQAMRVGFERLFDDDSGSSMETERIIERMDKLEEEIEENRKQIERVPFQYPEVEELAEEVVYRLGKEGRAKKEESGKY